MRRQADGELCQAPPSTDISTDFGTDVAALWSNTLSGAHADALADAITDGGADISADALADAIADGILLLCTVAVFGYDPDQSFVALDGETADEESHLAVTCLCVDVNVTVAYILLPMRWHDLVPMYAIGRWMRLAS